mgnify:CR=1 FL=1
MYKIKNLNKVIVQLAGHFFNCHLSTSKRIFLKRRNSQKLYDNNRYYALQVGGMYIVH